MNRLVLVILILFTCTSNNIIASTSVYTNNHNQKQPSDSILIAYLQQEYNIFPTANNQIKLLKSGEEKFIDLFEEIRKAKHHIHLEYFNFRNDSIANTLFDLLAEKVKE